MSIQTLRHTVLLAIGLQTACAPVLAQVHTDDDTSPPIDDCQGSPVIGPDGRPTGFIRCADGVLLREQAQTQVPTTITETRCTAPDGACTSDAECTDGVEGACLDRGIQIEWCTCVYACSQDSDCGEGEICLPPGVWEGGPAWGTCVPASCTLNTDCPSQECSFTVYDNGCSLEPRLACRAPDDDCRTDADCADPYAPSCAFNVSDEIACRGPDCDIGRPLVQQDGGWRTAPVVPRSDWAAELDALGELPEPDRQALVAHWTRIAALEHASVASFARHTLELMALGAPPELLSDVQAAAADEVEHARLAFGVVRALGGPELGPGALELHAVSPRTTPADVLRGLLQEGCLGETFGAAEAELAALRASGPLAHVLRTIARDETRHAALAWRTVRWLVQAHPQLLPLLDAVSGPGPASAGPPHRLSAHGRLTSAERAALHHRVFVQVVQPALRGLRRRPSSTPPAAPGSGRSTPGCSPSSPTGGGTPGVDDRRSRRPTA